MTRVFILQLIGLTQDMPLYPIKEAIYLGHFYPINASK